MTSLHLCCLPVQNRIGGFFTRLKAKRPYLQIVSLSCNNSEMINQKKGQLTNFSTVDLYFSVQQSRTYGLKKSNFFSEAITMSNAGYHEPSDKLSKPTRDMHRAIISLMEELEAIDLYNQRVDLCKNEELKAILAHNRDEEKEHASMLLEWIRRSDPSFDKELKNYLFTDKPLTHK